MANILVRGFVTALGAAGSYTAFKELKPMFVTPPIPPTLMEIILYSPVSKKAALAATSVTALAMTYLLATRKATVVEEKEEVVEELPVVTSVKITEESIIQGSTLSDRLVPGCQGFIAIKKQSPSGPELEIVGCCFRTDYGLWVPSHVLGSEPEKLYVIGKKQSRAVKGGEMVFHVPQIPLQKYYSEITNQIQFGTEMVSIPMDQNDMSALGLSSAKMGNLPSKTMVTVVGPQGKSSMGELVPGSILGSVRYYGTTLAGFSGAPYMQNGRVVGVHLHGGAGGNGGQEIMYLNQLYKIERGIQDESMGSLDTGAKVMELAFKTKKELKFEAIGDFLVFRDDSGFYHRAKPETYAALSEKYNYQDLDSEDYSDDEASYYGGNPEDYDRYHKKGRFSDESKRPFLGKKKRPSRVLSEPPTPSRIQRDPPKEKKRYPPLWMQLKNLSEELQNMKKQSSCPPPTPVQAERSIVSSSSSPGGV